MIITSSWPYKLQIVHIIQTEESSLSSVTVFYILMHFYMKCWGACVPVLTAGTDTSI